MQTKDVDLYLERVERATSEAGRAFDENKLRKISGRGCQWTLN